jgi:hypothetical protein
VPKQQSKSVVLSDLALLNSFIMISNALLVAGLAGFAAAATTNTNLQTVFPTATATTNLAAVKTIAAGASFDGAMKQWDRSRACFHCQYFLSLQQ